MSSNRTGFFAFVQNADKTTQVLFELRRGDMLSAIKGLAAGSTVIAVIDGDEKTGMIPTAPSIPASGAV